MPFFVPFAKLTDSVHNQLNECANTNRQLDGLLRHCVCQRRRNREVRLSIRGPVTQTAADNISERVAPIQKTYGNLTDAHRRGMTGNPDRYGHRESTKLASIQALCSVQKLITRNYRAISPYRSFFSSITKVEPITKVEQLTQTPCEKNSSNPAIQEKKRFASLRHGEVGQLALIGAQKSVRFFIRNIAGSSK